MLGRRPFSDHELTALLAAFTGKYAARDRLLVILGKRTGYRIRELLSLCVSDVWSAGRPADFVTVRRSEMKGKHAGRTIPLHEEAKAAVSEWMGALEAGAGSTKPSAALFQGRIGVGRRIGYRQALDLIQRAAKLAGISGPIGTHSMRKTFALAMHDKLGRDLLKTRLALGHSSISSTVAYLASCDDEIAAAILG